MDVLSPYVSRSTPFTGRPGGPSTLARLRREWLERLDRARSSGPGSSGPERAAAAERTSRHLLLGWTAAQILLGLGLLAWVSVNVPIHPAIVDPKLNGTALEGPTGGILLWTVFGLMGSVRSVTSRDSQVHFTFNLPFVGAATILGGPAAGAWVAFLSTIERRELESQPWFGILANHALMVIAAIAGGITVAISYEAILAATGEPALARFASMILGGVVLELGMNLLAGVTFMLRDRMTLSGMLGMQIEDFGRVTLLEIGLMWVLAVAFTEYGWWAPLVVGVAVLGAVQGPRRHPHDPLTGLMLRVGWDERLSRKIGWMRRGILGGATIVSVDLIDFELVTAQHGRQVADYVLKATAQRLHEVCPRQEDLIARIDDHAFALFFAGLANADVAMRKADELREAICRPIATPAGPVSVAAAIGVTATKAWGGVPNGSTLLRWADQAMHLAMRDAGPCGGTHLHAADDVLPFDDEWPGDAA